MLTRRFAAFLLLTVVLAGCANNGTSVEGPVSVASDSAPASTPASPTSGSSSPGSSSPGSPTAASPTPSASKPTATGAQTTISGTVAEGIEPKCLIVRDAGGSHVLYFDDPALRSAVKVGAQVTLIGRSEPTMMTTCQQGVAFVVSSVKPG
jgi:hypothetical protein